MAIASISDLTPRQKAAVVVMTLGSEAKELLSRLSDDQVEELAGEFVQLGEVPDSVRDEVLVQFHNKLAATQVTDNGLQRAAKVLEASLGKEQAGEAVRRMEWRANQKLRSYARLDPKRFATMIEQEHPQTAAFLLTQLDQPVSAKVIEALSEKWQHEMVWRIATMREIPPDVASAVHGALASKYRTQGGGPTKHLEGFGGEQKAASVLTMVGMDAQRSVLETLATLDSDIAKRVRKLMFLFKDILMIDDRGIQRLLKDVDTKILVLALKDADEVLKGKFFKNVSERMRQTLKDEIEFLRNPKPIEIEEARDTIIDQVRALEEKGEIVIDRSGGTAHAG